MPWAYEHVIHGDIRSAANGKWPVMSCIYCGGVMVKSERIEAPVVDDDPRYLEAGIVVARCGSLSFVRLVARG